MSFQIFGIPQDVSIAGGSNLGGFSDAVRADYLKPEIQRGVIHRIHRLLDIAIAVEGYPRPLRKVIKNKSSFSTPQAGRKLLYLATMNITKKWTAPIRNWPLILYQLAIRFEDRWPE